MKEQESGPPKVSGRIKRIVFQDFGIEVQLLRNPTVFTLDEYRSGAREDARQLVEAFFENVRVELLLNALGPDIEGVRAPISGGSSG